MKQASWFEIVMARCWNLLNEGKPFTPIFTVGVTILFMLFGGTEPFDSWAAIFGGLVAAVPAFIVYYAFDFPLWLRRLLWIPLAAAIATFGPAPAGMYVLAFCLYAFFTVFFWGTLYYHLRIGTPWTNFMRIWKLFLLNSDSTSGNVLEQLPKIALLLTLIGAGAKGGLEPAEHLMPLLVFQLVLAASAWLAHFAWFRWKPVEYGTYTDTSYPSGKPLAKRVVVVVIDGCRKDKLEAADAPFLHRLMREGTVFETMETTYPARTVCCFSSMFTGTYPREHGIRSNMVWSLGVKVESLFDVLKRVGRKGVLFGCAHLIDAFGKHVESFTAVCHNDLVDGKIMDQAKEIYARENPDLFVVQMIAVDQTGHSRGVHYSEYLQKIKESDALIADFHRWLTERGDMEETAFVVMADHGQGDGIGGHGHLDRGERFVPFFMHGPMIRPGLSVREHRSIVSLAPTISTLLGVPVPERSRGPVLHEAFISPDKREETA